MSKNKVVKSVSFNITDQNDQAMLERIKDINFSGYVKKLIEKDMKSRKIIKGGSTSPEPQNRPLGNDITVGGGITLKLV